jgi:thiol-disulfide isomerase/thioredoxin
MTLTSIRRTVGTRSIALRVIALAMVTVASHGAVRAQRDYKPVRVGDKFPDITLPLLGSRNEKIRVQDLRGRPVVFYLWATWCPSCVATIPLMNEMQSRFGDSVRIILVNDFEKRSVVERFVAKRANNARLRINLPIVFGDSILTKVILPHHGVPQLYWLNASGEISYHTSKADITEENIRSFIRAGTIDEKKPPAPIRLTTLWKSELDLGDKGDYSRLTLKASGGSSISCSGYTIRDLYRFAFGSIVANVNRERVWIDPLLQSRVVIEGLPAHEAASAIYSYALKAPDFTAPERLCDRMKADLDNYFGLRALMEKRSMKYYSLTIPDTMRFYGKATGKRVYKITDVEFYLNNIPVHDVLQNLEAGGRSRSGFPGQYPVVDNSGYKGLLADIEVDVDTSDPAALDRALSKCGLRLQLVEGPLEVLVVRPANQD